MNYTDNTEQIVFLRDADIASSLDGKTVSGKTILSNGLPSFDLFKGKYEELSTYDNNVCAYIRDSIEVSVHNLCTEISDLRDEAKTLSTNICVSVDYISGFVRNTISVDLYTLSAGTAATSTLLSNQIIALWDDVRGGVNYKGHLYNFETTKPFGKNLNLSGIFALKYNLYDTETWELSANKTFNNGWLYNVTLTGGEYVTNDGVKIENNDYFIIHNHDLSCVDVSCIDRTTIDIIEAVQDDYVRFALLKQISDYLSTDYVAKIGALSDALSGDINKLSTALSTDINALSTQLSNRIDDLSTSLSNITKLSVENLQDQIISNDEDIKFISSCVSTEIVNNIDSLHFKGNLVIGTTDHSISTILYNTIGSISDYKFRKGFMYRVAKDWQISDSNDASYNFEVNDYMFFKNDAILPEVYLSDLNYIKDYDVDVAFLSGFAKNVISADLYRLSDEVSAVSTYICISVDEISTTLTDVSTGLSTHLNDLELSVNGISTIVDDLSTDLSTDIDVKYNDLSTQIKETSSYISAEVSKNDTDILNIQNYISSENSLCTELSNVEYHYNKTFTEQHYTKGGTDIDVDVLNIVNSEDLAQKFVLVYLSGTMVLSAI